MLSRSYVVAETIPNSHAIHRSLWSSGRTDTLLVGARRDVRVHLPPGPKLFPRCRRRTSSACLHTV